MTAKIYMTRILSDVAAREVFTPKKSVRAKTQPHSDGWGQYEGHWNVLRTSEIELSVCQYAANKKEMERNLPCGLAWLGKLDGDTLEP